MNVQSDVVLTLGDCVSAHEPNHGLAVLSEDAGEAHYG